ncbi:hypothetical protein K503DRAFT_133620 [Rhizopogon vinicolor AM-OR11-026]|uniref:Uncharacterized protein n=1 Tax=Rhizopogon vinicolor AM-OR11-026 TaxID=1314800 RepID=A0A1B7N1T4_9AGAM|nr:hypothetical protein K503DRAFT_133620 [Rhizopogon vinicolor AM-OR11-026]
MLMFDMSQIEDNAMVPGGLKWLPVIGNVSGFLLIMGTVYLLHLFLWPRVSLLLSAIARYHSRHGECLSAVNDSHSGPSLRHQATQTNLWQGTVGRDIRSDASRYF